MSSHIMPDDDDGYNVLDEATNILAGLQFEGEYPAVDMRVLAARIALLSERECLKKILPALIEARQVIQEAKISKGAKKRIQRQLAHASEHLHNNLEFLRHLSRADEQ